MEFLRTSLIHQNGIELHTHPCCNCQGCRLAVCSVPTDSVSMIPVDDQKAAELDRQSKEDHDAHIVADAAQTPDMPSHQCTCLKCSLLYHQPPHETSVASDSSAVVMTTAV